LDRPSKGLCGNFNGWKTLCLFSQASEISQWITAQQDLPEEAEPPSQLKTLEVGGKTYLLQQFQSSDVVTFGQLAIDRQPTPEMTTRKHAWASAISQRTQGIQMRPMPHEQRVTVEHACAFCSDTNQEGTNPSWLYDRVQHRTILVSEECADGVPPYEVLSYTWGRAASNEW